jgi:predicted RNase H-like HicB family nuclease
MKTFRVVYEREPDGRWTVSVPDVKGCHTYGRTIAQARERIREALGLFVPERTAAAAKFAEEIQLPAAARNKLQSLREIREQFESCRQRMSGLELEVVQILRNDVQLGQRDVGELIGVSFQRVHQLESGAE